ncbi:MAG TPA: ABC transporter substrate-binding protein, partial [Dehalococcoidia bacterium]|nr:ABC transporter substrate-binding protein [Dehalococcoidia bacterium]
MSGQHHLAGVIGATEENTAPYEYNPDLARQLLEEANYDPNNKITILGRGTRIPKQVEVYEAIQFYLQQVGMNVEINVVEVQTFLDSRNC